MKAARKKYNPKYTIGIFLGILISVFILFSQSFYFIYFANVNEMISQDFDKDCEDFSNLALSIYLTNSGRLNNSISDDLNYMKPTEFYSYHAPDYIIKSESSIEIVTDKNTLFSMIIIPNAP